MPPPDFLKLKNLLPVVQRLFWGPKLGLPVVQRRLGKPKTGLLEVQRLLLERKIQRQFRHWIFGSKKTGAHVVHPGFWRPQKQLFVVRLDFWEQKNALNKVRGILGKRNDYW